MPRVFIISGNLTRFTMERGFLSGYHPLAARTADTKVEAMSGCCADFAIVYGRGMARRGAATDAATARLQDFKRKQTNEARFIYALVR